MAKLYKIYTYIIFQNPMNKLSQIYLKKSLEPKNQFMNKLNHISKHVKEFGIYYWIGKNKKTKKFTFQNERKGNSSKRNSRKKLIRK